MFADSRDNRARAGENIATGRDNYMINHFIVSKGFA
jgi:hypothetical protein